MPAHLTFQEFRQHIHAAREATPGAQLVVPVYRRLSADLLTPVSAYLALRAQRSHTFLLESVEGGEKLARYSFLGGSPYQLLQAKGEEVTLYRDGHEAAHEESNLFDALQREMDRWTAVPLPDMPRFTGGAVGYVGYDAVRLLERLPSPPPDDLDLPDAIWAFYDTIAAFDHARHQLLIMASAFVSADDDLREKYDEAVGRLESFTSTLSISPQLPAPVKLTEDEPASNIEREEFEAGVTRAKRHIYDGDIFQVVLSQRFAVDFEGDAFNLYRALRQVNPSPYLFYLDLDAFAIAGSSPEVLVRVEDSTAEVLPIAGTRPRGETVTEDEALAAELAEDPKERAEHLMLVDLGRNDLSRVCNYGSVKVDRYAFIERYSHVMHIVSSVSGELEPDQGALHALAACFPAGTVSGAPKVRAMELIDELEPSRRSVYAGAVGYLDFSGSMDTCIAIRTMVLREQTAYIQAGAGIVADSDPASEYEETKNKARALHEAMRVAAEELL